MPEIMLTWRWYAKMYGYTPDQVNELPIECLTWFPLIEESEGAAQEMIQKEEINKGNVRR